MPPLEPTIVIEPTPTLLPLVNTMRINFWLNEFDVINVPVEFCAPLIDKASTSVYVPSAVALSVMVDVFEPPNIL